VNVKRDAVLPIDYSARKNCVTVASPNVNCRRRRRFPLTYISRPGFVEVTRDRVDVPTPKISGFFFVAWMRSTFFFSMSKPAALCLRSDACTASRQCAHGSRAFGPLPRRTELYERERLRLASAQRSKSVARGWVIFLPCSFFPGRVRAASARRHLPLANLAETLVCVIPVRVRYKRSFVQGCVRHPLVNLFTERINRSAAARRRLQNSIMLYIKKRHTQTAQQQSRGLRHETKMN